MVLPNFGSGVAAKQYDPGAPFFLSLSWKLGATTGNDPLQASPERVVKVLASSQLPAPSSQLYLFGLPGGLSLLNTALFFSI